MIRYNQSDNFFWSSKVYLKKPIVSAPFTTTKSGEDQKKALNVRAFGQKQSFLLNLQLQNQMKTPKQKPSH